MFLLQAIMVLIGWFGLWLEALLDGGHEAAAIETKDDMWLNLLSLSFSLFHTQHTTHMHTALTHTQIAFFSTKYFWMNKKAHRRRRVSHGSLRCVGLAHASYTWTYTHKNTHSHTLWCDLLQRSVRDWFNWLGLMSYTVKSRRKNE